MDALVSPDSRRGAPRQLLRGECMQKGRDLYQVTAIWKPVCRWYSSSMIRLTVSLCRCGKTSESCTGRAGIPRPISLGSTDDVGFNEHQPVSRAAEKVLFQNRMHFQQRRDNLFSRKHKRLQFIIKARHSS